MRTILYSQIRKAMKDKPYDMKLSGEDGRLAERAVNSHPIDAHLEACYVKERGDSYEWRTKPVGRNPKAGVLKLECVVSVESLPVLLRRLTELEPEQNAEGGDSLAAAILSTLGIDVSDDCFEVISDNEAKAREEEAAQAETPAAAGDPAGRAERRVEAGCVPPCEDAGDPAL